VRAARRIDIEVGEAEIIPELADTVAFLEIRIKPVE
jgi:Holliday junction resolvase-like predicted endonuclease